MFRPSEVCVCVLKCRYATYVRMCIYMYMSDIHMYIRALK